MNSLLAWILLLPFAASTLLGFLHLAMPKNRAMHPLYAFIGVAAPLGSAILGIIIIIYTMGTDAHAHILCKLFDWLDIGDLHAPFTLMIDRLSAVMLFVVTFVGTIIHIYAVGYMKDDEGFGKFFSYFNFFIGSMLLLILANNPIIMFIGWELVGIASYLLIGYYYKDRANVSAANKAFILNRIGDFGFVSALALLFSLLHTDAFTFEAIKGAIGQIDHPTLSLIGILLFMGAMGKSAQIPLHVWLPDAMAGPTPVSALIHAATMVTAGVYMVARFSFLYNQIPHVGTLIATIGAASAFFAALIACYQSDIKKILAYSTISQLGYMFIGVGLGAYSSGIFHLFTHAFFKALLFMGAGAVIIALHHEQNIFKMGGVHKHLSIVSITMLIATLAISGIPPFAGFFSKDAILSAAFASSHYIVWAIGVLTAFLTAFYMFRLYFVVFISPPKMKHQFKPLPFSMIWTLIVLAVGSAAAGFLDINSAYGGSEWLSRYLALPDMKIFITHDTEYTLDTLNILLAVAGITLAYRLYAKSPKEAEADDIWHTLVLNKFYIDQVYEVFIVRPLYFLSKATGQIVDKRIIDGTISIAVGSYRLAGKGFTLLQNGNIRWYALYMLIGLAGLSLYLMQKLGI